MKRLHTKLMVGEANATLKTFPKESVDLLITSPPYDDIRAYNGYTFDFPTFRSMARQMYRVLRPGGVLVWVVGDRTTNSSESLTSMRQAIYFRDSVGFLAYDTMIYYRLGPPQTKRRYEQHFEYMHVMTKGVPKTFNGIRSPKLYPEKKARVKAFSRNPDNSVDMGTNNVTELYKLEGNVWKIPCQRSGDEFSSKHPAPFPEELARRHIHTWSNPGDIICDPMMGSGTTGKVALSMGREFVGIDISAEYVALATERLRASCGPKHVMCPPRMRQIISACS